MDVKVKCKRCGKEASSQDFVLDYTYRMMVCPNCIRERKTSETVKKELIKEGVVKEPKRPAGWDAEDEYLENVYAARARNTVKVEKVGDDKVKYRCASCKYEFLINIQTKVPKSCPYCDTPVSRMTL